MHRVVPELIVENYREGRFRGEFPAIGLFLDLSGFSSMTDTLMTHGQHGAEVLANLMHGVFDPLVEGIFDYGGKIVGFAGDGIMALFPIEADVRRTTLSALASAWLIQERLGRDPGRSTVYGKFQFTAKIGLTCGEVSWGILRSDDRRNATYYFRGSAVDESAWAEHQARAGETLITEEMRHILDDWIQVEPAGSLYRVTGFQVELPVPVPGTFPPVDLETSRIFMPEEIIAQDARGEFRQVVNLFMHFPDLSDEDLQEATHTIFELRKKYGGLLNRIDFGDKGCNILILWGAPISYENDISRALNFVLDLQEHVNFPVTAGVTYYVAHAGYLGSTMCEDYTCYGWGVNLASRFMMNAPSGEVWVDDRIARRVSSRFELESMGEQRFKGFATPQKVHRLRRYNFIVESAYQGEIVGREQELAELETFITPLWNGKFAGVLLVLGDAGVGKGRLVQAFRYSTLFESRKALWAVCQSEQILRQSFNPFRSWLLRYFGLIPVQDVEARKKAFDSKLNQLIRAVARSGVAQELDHLRSVLGALVDLFWEDSFYEQLDAESRYNTTLLALISLIKAESLLQPVILFVEDVQFIDDDSLHFLPRLKRALLGGGESYPVAVIATSRIESHNPVLASDLVDREMRLHGLTREAVARLVEILLGGVPSLELVHLVMERSEGNPYFVEQIIRYLQEENLIEMSAKGWTAVRIVHQSFLPGDIGALLVARLDQLSRKVRDVVHTASVFGREFLLAVLVEMMAEGRAIEQYVSEAEQSAIWTGDDQRRYIFTHGLLRDAAYAMQMRSRRQELHTQAVEALERVYTDDLKFHYAELAYHAERASLREKSLQYYLLAGKSASAAYQNTRAIEYFTTAMSFISANDLAAKFDLLAERVELYNRLGKRDLQWSDLTELELLGEQMGDGARFSKAMMLHTTYFYLTGNYVESTNHARRAFVNSRPETDPETFFTAHISWFLSRLRLGQANEAMLLGQESLRLARVLGDRRQLGRVLTAIGLVAFEQKEPAAAEDYLVEALDIAHELKDRHLRSRALNNLANFEIAVRGDYAQAHEYYRQALEIARAIGDRNAEVFSLGNLGFAASMLGNHREAKACYEKSLPIARESGNTYNEIWTLVNLSSNAGVQNQPDLSLEYARQAIDLSQTVGELSGEAWGWLYRGHAHLLLGAPEDARSAYRRSLDIRERLGQTALSMEPLAGLVEAGMYTGELSIASGHVEQILLHLQDGGTLNGTDEPLRIYYTCYRLLERKQDLRAAQVLQLAIQLLESQLSKFKDEDSRRMYVENVPWRLALYELVPRQVRKLG